MKLFGSNLDLIQEEADADDGESDNEMPFNCADGQNMKLCEISLLPLGELTVKNTFLDIDKPVKLGLRTVKTADGRLDGLFQLDCDDDDDWAH